MVTQGILIGCVEQLLQQKLVNNKIDEEFLEVALKLLTKIGSLLNMNSVHDVKINNFFFIIENVANCEIKDSNGKPIYSSRIRFLSKDLIDLKKVNFV